MTHPDMSAGGRTAARLRLGIVGCGLVTQAIHLPVLRRLRDAFAVAAICDVSATLLDAVGEEWRVAGRYTDWRDLVQAGDVDAVLVAAPHALHCDVAIAAMAAGKHVLIEKPMCMTIAEADALIACERRTGVVAQLGYVRCHAPEFRAARDLVRRTPDIRLARVHDMIGRNALIVDQVAAVIRPSAIPAELAEAARALEARKIREAIGDASAALCNAYMLMLGLSTHDISAMRMLLGAPERVLFAAMKGPDGRDLTAAFDYGGFVCQFSTGVDLVPRTDISMEVFSPSRTIRLEYDTPFVRSNPGLLSVTEAGESGMAHTTSCFSWRDSFELQWLDFHANVVGGKTPETSLAGGRADLALIGALVEAMRQGGAR